MTASFFDPRRPALKVCGVTRAADAEKLVALGVGALGANFWPRSKRYLAPDAADFLGPLAGRILRVGVFVNAGPDLPRTLFERGLIDVVQLHGDEPDSEAADLIGRGVPVIRALGVASAADLAAAAARPATALLLDAHAPGVYGGTGRTIDWRAAGEFVAAHPRIPVILAGGITPENAAAALAAVRPAAIDTASGSESMPGVKDFGRVEALCRACREVAAGDF